MIKLKCEAKATRKAINHRGRSISPTRAQCSQPGWGSTTGDNPNRPPKLSALGLDVDRLPGMMPDHPLMPFSTPTLCWVLDQPPGLIAQRRNLTLIFYGWSPRSIRFLQNLKMRENFLKYIWIFYLSAQYKSINNTSTYILWNFTVHPWSTANWPLGWCFRLELI